MSAKEVSGGVVSDGGLRGDEVAAVLTRGSETLYLGDGVYASFDGFQIRLEANVPATDTIYLDSETASALYSYIGRLMAGGL